MRFRIFIDRIAARFGYYRSTPLPIELIVFHTAEHARRAGFYGERHPQHEHLRAWWPSQGMIGLMGPLPQRVTLTEDMALHRTPEGRVADILRRRQMLFGDNAIWVELR
jgi:hypothetical protein